jgi:hypothetical protein
MNNNNETLGLRIESTNPSHLDTNVNVWNGIKITFTSDIDPSTLASNIVVFKDYNNIYKNIESLKDYSKYGVVNGSVSYADKVVTFTPSDKFETNMRYILVVNNKIADITGNILSKKYVVAFTTETVESFPKSEFTAPKYGLLTGIVPEFSWKDLGAPSYEFQLSKNNSFELLLFDESVVGTSITPNINYEEGAYFARVKAERGEWSDAHQIFIKPITDAVVAKEDTPNILNYDEFMDGLKEPLEILEVFPAENSGNISLKTNIIYIKIKGRIDISQINLHDCYVIGESIDEEHDEYAHGIIDGDWSVVYDVSEDITYIIFTPAELTTTEKTETEI